MSLCLKNRLLQCVRGESQVFNTSAFHSMDISNIYNVYKKCSGAKEGDYATAEEATAPCTPSHTPAAAAAAPATDATDEGAVSSGGALAVGTLTFISCGAGSDAAAGADTQETEGGSHTPL